MLYILESGTPPVRQNKSWSVTFISKTVLTIKKKNIEESSVFSFSVLLAGTLLTQVIIMKTIKIIETKYGKNECTGAAIQNIVSEPVIKIG